MKTIWTNPAAKQCLTRTSASFYPSLLTTRISFPNLKEFLETLSDFGFVFTGIIETPELSIFCDVRMHAFSGDIYKILLSATIDLIHTSPRLPLKCKHSRVAALLLSAKLWIRTATTSSPTLNGWVYKHKNTGARTVDKCTAGSVTQ